jgi:hypothetical protein
VRDPHEDGVAECETEAHSVAEKLSVAQCVALMLVLPLTVTVGQALALVEAVAVLLDVEEDVAVADAEGLPEKLPDVVAEELAVTVGVYDEEQVAEVLVEEVEVKEEELEPVAVPDAVPEPLPVAVKLAVALGLPVRELVFDVVDDAVTLLLFEATAVPLDVADDVTERVPVADPLSVEELDPVRADEPEGEAVVELDPVRADEPEGEAVVELVAGRLEEGDDDGLTVVGPVAVPVLNPLALALLQMVPVAVLDAVLDHDVDPVVLPVLELLDLALPVVVAVAVREPLLDALEVDVTKLVADHESLGVKVAKPLPVAREGAALTEAPFEVRADGEGTKFGALSRNPKYKSSRAKSFPFQSVCAFVRRIRAVPSEDGPQSAIERIHGGQLMPMAAQDISIELPNDCQLHKLNGVNGPQLTAIWNESMGGTAPVQTELVEETYAWKR